MYSDTDVYEMVDALFHKFSSNSRTDAKNELGKMLKRRKNEQANTAERQPLASCKYFGEFRNKPFCKWRDDYVPAQSVHLSRSKMELTKGATMNIELTKKQTDLLKPVFKELGDNQEKLGAVFAQVVQTNDGGSFMVVRFIESETAEKVQDILRRKPGVIKGGTEFDVIPVEDE